MSYHPAETDTAPEIPARLGRYELLGQLATGGMAEIHLARLAGEAGFEKTVVVKRLLPELVASKAYVAMFLDEGKLVARLDHPNVCEVHELGRDGAEYFLVMPYLDGVPASDFIARPRDPDRIAQLRVAAGIIVQACAGLHHAHELKDAGGAPLGLVHRDVSPSNLFVTTAGAVKVLDFGIAKVHGGAETEAGTIKGKTQYMAPEQLLGESLDRRCDVFALGIVLFELATHSRLFKRASDYLAARAILEEPIPRADAIDPAVPAALADVIAKALERDKAQRFADARELGKAVEVAMAPHGGVASADQIAAALAEWHGAELSAMRTRQAKVIADARSRTQTAAGSPSPAEPPTVPGKVARSETSLLTTHRSVARKRRRGVYVLATLVLAGSGAVGALVLTRDRGQPARSVEAPPVPARQEPTVEPIQPPPVDVHQSDIEPTSNEPETEQLTAGETGTDNPRTTAKHQPTEKPRSHDRRPRIDKRPRDDKPVPAAAQPGFVRIDSTPYADIFVDGVLLGRTPLIDKPLPAGKHTLKAVLKDGRTKTRRIDVPSGKLLQPPITFTW